MREPDHRPDFGELLFHRDLEAVNPLVSRDHALGNSTDRCLETLYQHAKVSPRFLVSRSVLLP